MRAVRKGAFRWQDINPWWQAKRRRKSLRVPKEFDLHHYPTFFGSSARLRTSLTYHLTQLQHKSHPSSKASSQSLLLPSLPPSILLPPFLSLHTTLGGIVRPHLAGVGGYFTSSILAGVDDTSLARVRPLDSKKVSLRFFGGFG